MFDYIYRLSHSFKVLRCEYDKHLVSQTLNGLDIWFFIPSCHLYSLFKICVTLDQVKLFFMSRDSLYKNVLLITAEINS